MFLLAGLSSLVNGVKSSNISLAALPSKKLPSFTRWFTRSWWKRREEVLGFEAVDDAVVVVSAVTVIVVHR